MNESKVVRPTLCAVLDKNGELWVTPVGMTFRSEEEAKDFIEWASLHRPETAPYSPLPLVTHADYRALEERLAESSARENFLADEVIHMAEELASIKARVGELVAAAENTLAVEKRYGLGGSASDRLSSALEAFK